MYKRKEIFSVPNILGYFRILLIPFFMYTYMTANDSKDYYVAAIIVGVSSLSDFFDGFIARKYNMVTELGKFVDPLADKLTQGALIICFIFKYHYMRYLLVLYIIKEGFMAIMGLVMLRHNGKKLDGAKWFGKVSTALVYIVMFILLLFPMMDENIVNALILLCGISMAATLVLYIPVFVKMYKEE